MPQFPAPDPLSGLTEIRPDGTPVEPTSEDQTTFIDDRWLASRIGMKVATIRSQRFKKLHGLDHWLELSPVYIGSKPRYRRSDAIGWLKSRVREDTMKV